ncbi:Ig-like domain-containing protein [Limnobacter sp.]|uniref:Ig-like domain-containing protein n=1 Tax=Limnobacter sp. TaxID=2003368 RepID=UPI0027331D77|nr:Ig-like domain-containing protein [Limnobacter sp.]MDP3186871.1 Ig-like domain-containing protein [Limnobacter sp.]
MSEKPVVNAQECDPSTLGLARKPRPAMKRKPQTEVVVQLGPFTDGQITAPEMVRPLEGPTEWLIKPKTGEIVPFDSGTPPEKDVIRKYITVGAQDNDVPEDLPKISEGYVVERVNQDPLPSMDDTVRENGKEVVRVVENGGPSSVECKDPPSNPPVTESEEPPPVEPPPPVEKCETPVDAVDDCASTQKDCPVVIDVLKNDIGGDGMNIIEASAENGTVEIKDGKLHYTPNEGFCGEDIISYTIGEENCLTDTAYVYMNVESGDTYDSGNECDQPVNGGDYAGGDYSDKDVDMHDQEYSSSPYNPDELFAEYSNQINQILQDKLDQISNLTQDKSSWGANFGASSFEASACAAPAEEPVATC